MHGARIALAAGAVLVSAGVVLGIALAGDPVASPSPVAQAVEAGRHVRLEGPGGPIHVFVPRGYHADTGATILYIHGYWDNADTAWTGHQLPEQLALSAANALFIVPEAPSSSKTPINYPDLAALIRRVEEEAGVTRGMALTAAIGHSGAFRTLLTWLDEPLLDQVILADAVYGGEDEFVHWFEASPTHRLITIGEDTVLGSEAVADRIPETVTLDLFPPTYELMPPEAKAARHVYIRAQFGHMAIVMGGVALPQVIRLLPVELLPESPWQLPPGALPSPVDAAGD